MRNPLTPRPAQANRRRWTGIRPRATAMPARKKARSGVQRFFRVPGAAMYAMTQLHVLDRATRHPPIQCCSVPRPYMATGKRRTRLAGGKDRCAWGRHRFPGKPWPSRRCGDLPRRRNVANDQSKQRLARRTPPLRNTSKARAALRVASGDIATRGDAAAAATSAQTPHRVRRPVTAPPRTSTVAASRRRWRTAPSRWNVPGSPRYWSPGC